MSLDSCPACGPMGARGVDRDTAARGGLAEGSLLSALADGSLVEVLPALRGARMPVSLLHPRSEPSPCRSGPPPMTRR